MAPVVPQFMPAIVVDKEGTVHYAEYVPVAGDQPNYDAALAAVNEIAR